MNYFYMFRPSMFMIRDIVINVFGKLNLHLYRKKFMKYFDLKNFNQAVRRIVSKFYSDDI